MYDQVNDREFEQTLGESEGQGSLACCRPWGRREQDRPERLNNNVQNQFSVFSSPETGMGLPLPNLERLRVKE